MEIKVHPRKFGQSYCGIGLDSRFRLQHLAAVAVFLFAALISIPGSASETGRDLLEACTAAERWLDNEVEGVTEAMMGVKCLAYLEGILDANGLSPISLSGRMLICTPMEGISVEQAARTVRRWLLDNPGDLHQSRRASAIAALSNSFPCD